MSENDHRSEGLSWEQANNRYLAASLAWLRGRLDALGPDRPEAVWADADRDLAEARDRAREAARAAGAPPALDLVAWPLDLSPFERDTLLLCAAPVFDPGIGALIARAQGGEPASPAPTFALALTLFDQPSWDALSPAGGLRYWHLVTPHPLPVQPLTAAPLAADERIAHLLKGLDLLDDRLAGALRPLADPAPGLGLPASFQGPLLTLAGALAAGDRAELAGPGVDDAALVTRRALGVLGLAGFATTAAALAATGREPEVLSRLWQRESLLRAAVLFIDAAEADPDDPVVSAGLRRFLDGAGPLVVLALRESWSGSGDSVVIDLDRPLPGEQRDLWAAATGWPADGVPARLAGQFRLSATVVSRLAGRAGPAAGPGGDPAPEQEVALWAGCLAATRPRLEALAQRSPASGAGGPDSIGGSGLSGLAAWDRLVLPGPQMDLLAELLGQVRHRTQVMSEWGFGRRFARGAGISALFAGPSGTGKTFTAEVLATELGVDLFRVDLSAVVDKYIGETEKNLRRVFDAAEDGGALLFFDEADALFGRRSEVKDSHDRYANIEVNYLLQRMESYRGLAILATNQRGALDPAFIRRLRFLVEFDPPGPAERRRLWAGAFPPRVPLGDLDLEQVVQLNANGAAIQQIALGAAFLAAAAGHPVDTGLVFRAARTEFRKLGLPLPPLPLSSGPPAPAAPAGRMLAAANGSSGVPGSGAGVVR